MSDNPTINRYLKDKVFDHIDHALGRPLFPLLESYRNHFATDEIGELARAFEASPFWTKIGISSDMAFYGVTQAGREALVKHLSELPDKVQAFVVSFAGFSRTVPARTRAKARYDSFLRISDVCPDLTFGEFCTRATVRRAA